MNARVSRFNIVFGIFSVVVVAAVGVAVVRLWPHEPKPGPFLRKAAERALATLARGKQ